MSMFSRYGEGPLAPHTVVLDCSRDPGFAKQSFKDECDINVLMRRYEQTGVLVDPGQPRRPAMFVDMGMDGLDYMSIQQRILDARKEFAGLPAKVRDRFSNRPEYLLDFLADPANEAEAVELGLLERPKSSQVKPGAEAPVVPAPAPPAVAAVKPPEVPKSGDKG